MNLLQLNTFGNQLPEARLKALVEFRKSIKKHVEKTKLDVKEVAKTLLWSGT